MKSPLETGDNNQIKENEMYIFNYVGNFVAFPVTKKQIRQLIDKHGITPGVEGWMLVKKVPTGMTVGSKSRSTRQLYKKVWAHPKPTRKERDAAATMKAALHEFMRPVVKVALGGNNNA